jgi:hypothetical protein
MIEFQDKDVSLPAIRTFAFGEISIDIRTSLRPTRSSRGGRLVSMQLPS